MQCECGGDTCVADSRPTSSGQIWRRRKCLSCKRRFTTREIKEAAIRDLQAKVDNGLTNEQTIERVKNLVMPMTPQQLVALFIENEKVIGDSDSHKSESSADISQTPGTITE